MGNNITNSEPPKIMKFHKFAGKIVVRFWSKKNFSFIRRNRKRLTLYYLTLQLFKNLEQSQLSGRKNSNISVKNRRITGEGLQRKQQRKKIDKTRWMWLWCAWTKLWHELQRTCRIKFWWKGYLRAVSTLACPKGVLYSWKTCDLGKQSLRWATIGWKQGECWCLYKLSGEQEPTLPDSWISTRVFKVTQKPIHCKNHTFFRWNAFTFQRMSPQPPHIV